MIEYRGYLITGDGKFGMQVVKTATKGGSIPDILKGLFTRPQEAKFAIDQYVLFKEELEARPPRVQKVKLTPREVKDDAEGASRD